MTFSGNTITNSKGHGIFLQRRRWWQFWRRRNRIMFRGNTVVSNTGHGIFIGESDD